ncbi:MAG: thiamine pyrophosphate-binding protein [Flavobacteriaceae bacterium]|nr:thiamine pyrophosphate-binding protein [Flavobacteriaceae bacterium]
MKTKVSDVIARFLKEKKIEVVFGIIGSANSHIFDSINNLGFTQIVNTHHEQVAVMAAGAYFRSSGKLSAAIVTAGAGASNAITGVISNWADSTPCLIISGQEPIRYVKKNESLRMYGTQGFNIIKMIKDVVKYGVSIADPKEIYTELSKIYRHTTEGRPGPCWVDIPFDIQGRFVEDIDFPVFEEINTESFMDEAKSVIESLKKSKRPVILGGNGIKLSNGKSEFQKFTSAIKAPTLLTWSGIDLLNDDNPEFFGRFGIYGQRCANFIIQNSDLVLVFGSRLALPQIGYDIGQFARSAKIIIIDIDETEGNKYDVHKFIEADCKTFLNDLNTLITGMLFDFSKWTEYCSKLKIEFPLIGKEHETKGYENSYKFIDTFSDLLGNDDIIVTDMGTALLSGHQAIKLKSNQIMFTSLGLGEMGYGLAGAIGASFACPSRQVICLNCDGGIMMNLQELHTIVENKLKIKIVIFNNDGYLMIKHTQKMLFKGNYNSVNKNTGIGLPNFEKLLPAFGYNYYCFDENARENSITAFLEDPNQSVLEVFMHPEQGFLPKVKGVLNNDNTILSPPLEEMSPIIPLDLLKEKMLIELDDKSYKIKR